ncbi:hypothetical protein RND71_034024 [Anisodus tanguticus]|uniref:Uncharacterized protein n=1 Tax=Anisodus tanguticus TaxID=243964 RepID=A0AAE1R9P1_9SOLA|nr:hypothetical protein RND71_034024 [Anisodus tanguticus]
MLQSLYKCQRNLCTKIRKTSLFVQFVSTSCGSNIPTDESKSLINLCHRKSHGLSKETLISEVKVLQLETDTCSKVSPVTEFFQNHGFSATQVKKLIRLRPKLLASKVVKTLKPKLKFLQSIGFSEDECIKCEHWLPSNEVHKSFVVRSLIVGNRLYRYCAKLDVGSKLKEMGFDVTSPAFRAAFTTMSVLSHSNLERKLETNRSLGFSDGEILNIFRSQPTCMFYTEENIRAIVGFYVDRLHFSLSLLSKRSNFLLCSLERRLIPRCSVMQVLWSRGIVSEVGKLYAKLIISEKDFLQKYVTKYEAEVHDLQAAFRGELMFNEYSFHLHEIRHISMSNGSSS